MVETWRAYGLVVFAGLFALLAWNPLGHRGLWELVIAHKVALTVTALLPRLRGLRCGTGHRLGRRRVRAPAGGLPHLPGVAVVAQATRWTHRPAIPVTDPLPEAARTTIRDR